MCKRYYYFIVLVFMFSDQSVFLFRFFFVNNAIKMEKRSVIWCNVEIFISLYIVNCMHLCEVEIRIRQWFIDWNIFALMCSPKSEMKAVWFFACCLLWNFVCLPLALSNHNKQANSKLSSTAQSAKICIWILIAHPRN